ncbi:hypothetical protein ETD83_38015 [Actinomadura soli]|uniref:Uncharacterized protein n=1 Tax=Actinomadura soli TaxID=2508997 RepID=A0A5C4IZX6_9ACTN|nr:hypothetical protein [Actinomadura soli]TMQ89855.1 hypothetical protein ETD83_38015 [Actinomadura soli]
MGDLGSVAIAGKLDADLVSPEGGALAIVEHGLLIACDRPDDMTERDNSWLDEVFERYGVTALPPPSYIAEGELAGWRCWILELENHP